MGTNIVETIQSRLDSMGMSQAQFAECISATPAQMSIFLREKVSQNPTIFPHVYDIDIPLRIKLRYFEVFRNIWNVLFPQTFRYISSVFLESNLRYLDMYYMFVDSNNITIKHSDFEDKLFGLSKQQCVGLTENFILSINDLIHSNVISRDNYNRIFNLFTKECSIIIGTHV